MKFKQKKNQDPQEVENPQNGLPESDVKAPEGFSQTAYLHGIQFGLSEERARAVASVEFPVIRAHWRDQPNVRFLWERFTGLTTPEEGFEVKPEDIKGYEEFPQIAWAVSREQLAEYKRIADDIRYQKAVKNNAGFWRNLGSVWADLPTLLSAFLGGAAVKGATVAGSALLRALGMSVGVRPAFRVIANTAATGAVSAAIDVPLHNYAERDLESAAKNATSGGIIGGLFGCAPALFYAMKAAGKSALFRSQVQKMADDIKPNWSQAYAEANLGYFAQKVGSLSPNFKLSTNVNPIIRDKIAKLTERSFDLYKNGEIVPQGTVVESVVDGKLSTAMSELNKGLATAFDAWANTTAYGKIARMFPKNNWKLAHNTAWEEFCNFLFEARLKANSEGVVLTGIEGVDNFLNSQYAPLMWKHTEEAFKNGVFREQEKVFIQGLTKEKRKLEKEVRGFEKKKEHLEEVRDHAVNKAIKAEEVYSEFLGESKDKLTQLSEGAFNRMLGAKFEAEGKIAEGAYRAEKIGEKIAPALKAQKKAEIKLEDIERKISIDPKKRTAAIVKELTNLKGALEEQDFNHKLFEEAGGFMEDYSLAEVSKPPARATVKPAELSPEEAIVDVTKKTIDARVEAKELKLQKAYGDLRGKEGRATNRIAVIEKRLNKLGFKLDASVLKVAHGAAEKLSGVIFEQAKKLGFKEGAFKQLSKEYLDVFKKCTREVEKANIALEVHNLKLPEIEEMRLKAEALGKKIKDRDYTAKEVLRDPDAYHFHRMFDRAAIEKNPEGFKKAVALGEKSIHPNWSDARCAKRAEEVYNGLTTPPDSKRHLSFTQRGAEVARTLEFKTSYIKDFLRKDIEEEGYDVLRTLIADTELEKIGMLDLDKATAQIQNLGEKIASMLEDPKAAALMRKDTLEGIEPLRQIVRRIRGESSGFFDYPTIRGRRVASNLMAIGKNAASMAFLGQVHLARLLDMFTTTLHLGLGNYLKGVFRVLPDDIRGISGLSRSEIDPFVRAIDQHGERFVQELGRVIEKEWWLTRQSRNAVNFMMTFSRLLDEHAKKTIGYATEEYLLNIGKKMKAGEIVSQKEINFARHLGLRDETLKNIAKEFELHGHTSERGIVFANTENWTDKSAGEALMSAIRKSQHENIVTPTKGSTPLFFDNPMLALVFQFKRCMFAATDKAMLPAIQMISLGEYGRVGSALAVGSSFSYFKEVLNDIGKGRERTEEERIKSAVSSVDIFAYGSYIKDIFEKLDEVDENSYMNSYRALEVIPVVSFARSGVQSLGALKKLYDGKRLSRSDLNAIKTITPMSSFFGWSRYLNGLIKNVGKDMMIPSFYRSEGVDLKNPTTPAGIASRERVKNVDALAKKETEAKKVKNASLLGEPLDKPVYKGKFGEVKKARGQYVFSPTGKAEEVIQPQRKRRRKAFKSSPKKED